MPSEKSSFLPVLDEKLLLDNSLKIVSLQGRLVVVAKREGKLFAFDNECPHSGGPLGMGTFVGNSVACPLHQWTFDLATGEPTKGPGARVRTYEVKVESGKIWVKNG